MTKENEALTPRHEAPADPFAAEDACLACHEAPAEGAGDDVAKLIYEAMKWAAEHAGNDNIPAWVEGGNSFAQDQARSFIPPIVAAFRARSSAPEAREGDFVLVPREPTGAMLKAAFVAMNDTPSGTWKKMKAEARHPIQIFNAKMRPRWAAMISDAPSADKLREALTWAIAEIQGDTHYENEGQREAALDQALDALKAEDA